MQDKIKLEFSAPKNVFLPFELVQIDEKTQEYVTKVVNIELKPYVDYAERNVLIDNYISDLFSTETGDFDFLGAEQSYKFALMQLLTNVDAYSLHADVFYSTNLWSLVTNNIVHYEEFAKDLNRAIDFAIREHEFNRSTSKTVQELITVVRNAIESMGTIDEGLVTKLKDTAESITKTANDTRWAPKFEKKGKKK
jgi:hypothetical protein